MSQDAKHRPTSPLKPLTREQQDSLQRAQVTRRSFIRKSGGVAALTVGAGVATAGLTDSAAVQEDAPATESPFDYTFDGVPLTPTEAPPDTFEALTEEEAAVVEALTARIMPGTPEDPGAREAGVVHYIDAILASNSGIHEATYTQAPWVRTYEGDAPPAEDDDATVWVQADQVSRYGYQAPISPLQVYKTAIPLVQEHAQAQYGAPVQDLDEGDQDRIVWDLLDENMDGWEQFSPRAFFHTLRRHTSEGMFSDPAYGGNRDLIGWKLVGFPGSQRAYSPEEMLTEDEPRPPQAMSELPHFNPGVTSHDDHRNVVQPVRNPQDNDGND